MMMRLPGEAASIVAGQELVVPTGTFVKRASEEEEITMLNERLN